MDRITASGGRGGAIQGSPFRALIAPYLDTIEDDEERQSEMQTAWEDFQRTMQRIGR